MTHFKFRTQLFCALFLILIGCGLLVAGIAIPPSGIIDTSILIAFGECCTFAATLFGVDYHYKNVYQINKNKKNEEK